MKICYARAEIARTTIDLLEEDKCTFIYYWCKPAYLLTAKQWSKRTNIKVSPGLVPSSWSTKAGPFEEAAQTTVLTTEIIQLLKRMGFEVSSSTLLVERCKIKERMPITKRLSWLKISVFLGWIEYSIICRRGNMLLEQSSTTSLCFLVSLGIARVVKLQNYCSIRAQ